MAEGTSLAELSVPVGQQLEVSLNVIGGAQAIFVLACDQGDIVVPALPDGTSLTWPHSVAIVDGVGTYYVLGLSPGSAQHSVTSATGSADADSSGSVYITVEHGIGGTIVEPIVISIQG